MRTSLRKGGGLRRERRMGGSAGFAQLVTRRQPLVDAAERADREVPRSGFPEEDVPQRAAANLVHLSTVQSAAVAFPETGRIQCQDGGRWQTIPRAFQYMMFPRSEATSASEVTLALRQEENGEKLS